MTPDVEFRRYHASGVGWMLTENGVRIESTGIERTPGAPTTATRICQMFWGEMISVAREADVPLPLLIATIATESRGRADALRFEPGYQDEVLTPHKVSVGLMQTLVSTAQEQLQMSLGIEALKEPLISLRAGARYIMHQRPFTRLDPVLVAAAYNAGTLAYQGGSQNRWKLRQFPIGTGLHIDRFVRFYNDAVCVLKKGGFSSGSSVDKHHLSALLPSSQQMQQGDPEVIFLKPENAALIPRYAIGVVKDILRQSRNRRATVTSTLRTPVDQARIMFENCERYGVDAQLKLYGKAGRAVVQEYMIGKEHKLGPVQIISMMHDKITALGPGNVSHHIGDPSLLCVLDLSPRSLDNSDRFIAAAKNDKRISKLLIPPRDPAIHIEIPLVAQAAS